MEILDLKKETMADVKKKELIEALVAMIKNYAMNKQNNEITEELN